MTGSRPAPISGRGDSPLRAGFSISDPVRNRDVGLSITLDCGHLRQTVYNPHTSVVRVPLDPLDSTADIIPVVRLRIKQPVKVPGVGAHELIEPFHRERGAWLAPLRSTAMEIVLNTNATPVN